MARKRVSPHPITEGSLALDRPYEGDYRGAAERYVVREAQRAEAPVKAKKPRVRLSAIALVVVFFLCAFALLFRQAQIERQVLELHTKRQDLKKAEQLSEALRLELSLGVSIDDVQRTAKDVMEMSYPQAEMTRELSLPPIQTGAQLEMANTVPGEEESSEDIVEGIAEEITP